MCPTPQRLLGFASGQRIQRALNLFYLPARQQTLTQNPELLFPCDCQSSFGPIKKLSLPQF
jgi:hypothetical protein